MDVINLTGIISFLPYRYAKKEHHLKISFHPSYK
jgi:hypothetical protein